MRITRVLAAAAVGLSALFAVAAPAGAQVTTKTIDLHNNTAGTATDCPTTTADYWHFVLAPNNNKRSFVTITLAFEDGTSETFSFTVPPLIIKNGNQTDNVFIQVPAGRSLTDLVTAGSSATYTGDTAIQFNLSSVCAGYTGAAGPEVLGETQVASDPQVAAAVQTSGNLPLTGSNSSIPMAQIGVALLAVGALVTFAVRKRHTSSSEV